MKSKGKKKEELDDLKKDLAYAKNLFVAQFQGMKVSQDSELRIKIRETKSKYRVVKNTLAKKAAEGTPAANVCRKVRRLHGYRVQRQRSGFFGEGADGLREDKSAVSFSRPESSKAASSIWPISQAIAAMPSKEELIAKLLFLINSPAQRLAVALNGVARNLAVVLQQAIEQKKFQE